MAALIIFERESAVKINIHLTIREDFTILKLLVKKKDKIGRVLSVNIFSFQYLISESLDYVSVGLWATVPALGFQQVSYPTNQQTCIYLAYGDFPNNPKPPVSPPNAECFTLDFLT